MPEEDKNIHHMGQYEEPLFDEEGLPEVPVNLPRDVPQEHLSHSSIASAPIKRASKSEIIKRFAYVMLSLIVLGVIGFAAWKLIPSRQAAKDERQAPAGRSSHQQTDADQADPIALALGSTTLSKKYTSDTLQVEISYPESWKVTDGSNFLLIKSPEFDLMDNSGVSSKSYFKVYIKRSTDSIDGKYLGKGYAVAPSEKISYTQPGLAQRKNTYLTDFGIDTSDNFAYFVLEGGFKLSKDDTLGPNFANESEAFLIAGGFSTDQQKDNLQTRIISMDGYKDNQAYKTGLEIAKSVKFD